MASPVSVTNYCNECDIDNHWISPTPVYFVMTRTWDQIIWIDTCRCITAPATDQPALDLFLILPGVIHPALFRPVLQVYKCDVKWNEQKCAVATVQRRDGTVQWR